MSKGSPIAVGVDLGSTSITALVLELRDSSPLVIGVGQASKTGLSGGTVVNIEETVEAIKRAVEEAEIMSSTQLREVYASISGAQITGLNNHGMVEVKGREVRRDDVQRVIAAARSISIPEGQQVVHVIPQEFIVDGQAGVQDPEGMSGVCLEARVHLVTAPISALEHVREAFHRAGLTLSGVMVQQVAAAEAVLTPDERELGVCLVDIGGGTTDIAVYVEGALAHTAVLPLAGDHVTGDLAQGLKTVRDEAERLKQKYGAALVTAVDPDEMVTIPAEGGRPPMDVSRQFIAEVLECRLEEILEMVGRELDERGLHEHLTGGIVLTGGSSLLRGVEQLAEEVLELPVRLGSPKDIDGLGPVVASPRFATALGLALVAGRGGLNLTGSPGGKGGLGIWRRTMNWLSDFF